MLEELPVAVEELSLREVLSEETLLDVYDELAADEVDLALEIVSLLETSMVCGCSSTLLQPVHIIISDSAAAKNFILFFIVLPFRISVKFIVI